MSRVDTPRVELVSRTRLRRGDVVTQVTSKRAPSRDTRLARARLPFKTLFRVATREAERDDTSLVQIAFSARGRHFSLDELISDLLPSAFPSRLVVTELRLDVISCDALREVVWLLLKHGIAAICSVTVSNGRLYAHFLCETHSHLIQRTRRMTNSAAVAVFMKREINESGFEARLFLRATCKSRPQLCGSAFLIATLRQCVFVAPPVRNLIMLLRNRLNHLAKQALRF